MIDDTKEVVKEEEKEVMVEETMEEAASDAPIATNLNLEVLVQLRNILNIASQRNAFRAEEFEVVGAVYNKLNTFVEAILPQMQENKEEVKEEVAEEVKEEVKESTEE